MYFKNYGLLKMNVQRLADSIDISTPDVFFDEAFHVMIAQHKKALLSSPGRVMYDLTPNEKRIWHGNFVGYMMSKNIPIYLHWIVMYINDIDSSLDFRDDIDFIVIPDLEMVSRLREYYNTTHSVN